MKRKAGLADYLACVAFLLLCTGCNVGINSDPGPTKTFDQEIDAGSAESARAEIRMGAGELHIQGGSPKLMSGSFRYSEQVGQPNVHFERTGSSGLLTVESPRSASGSLTGRKVNEWTLRMGSQTPLEMSVKLGGGDANLDFSTLLLRSVDVQMGAGELHLNLSGNYKNDVTATVNGGAGSTEIRLPADMGVVVDARVGIGGVDAGGLTKRDDGKYYNGTYDVGKPAIRLKVQGGVGDIKLDVGK